jgi:hypothetical protein
MWHKVKRWTRQVIREQAGQSLLIMALAFVSLLVIIGLAIDLGLVYIERIQLGRACDAAALAAAQELPFEDFAVKRAMHYLAENGYDPNNTELVVLGPKNSASLSWPAPPDSRGTVTIDTETFEDRKAADPDNSADKIRVYGRINVPMNFMKFVGFDTVPVEAQAIAENVSNLDVVIVFDESGSMNDDTYCYGCYIKADTQEYPEGERKYMPYDASFCQAQAPIDYNGQPILVAEAEYFSYSTSYGQQDYHRDNYVNPNTFWMIQRTAGSQASGQRYTKDDMRGAHMMHEPQLAEIPGHPSVTKDAPRLDYAFSIPRVGRWYVWLRAQCGNYSGSSQHVDGCITHWGVDQSWSKGGSTSPNDFLVWNSSQHRWEPERGGNEAGSNGNRWRWVRVGYADFSDTKVHTINIWGGGTGFRLDKIVLTQRTDMPDNRYDDWAPAFIRDTTPSWSDVRNQTYQTYFANKRYGGPPDTKGRSGYACDQCNPIYGLRIDANGDGKIDIGSPSECDNTTDDMWDDQQPIRATKEAGKRFVQRMQARFDQVGFVKYSDQAFIERELNCILTPSRSEHMPSAPGVYEDISWIWCYDHRTGPGGYTGPRDIVNVTHGSIIGALEEMSPNGFTNIADGLRQGMTTLSSDTGHYGRPNAAKFLVLMTDGQANRYPDDLPSETCYGEDLWPDNSGDVNQIRARDCVIYFTYQARARSIVVFTIGLGINADHQLLAEVANQTGGEYFFAPKGKDLDRIMQEIADKIFLRLVE